MRLLVSAPVRLLVWLLRLWRVAAMRMVVMGEKVVVVVARRILTSSRPRREEGTVSDRYGEEVRTRAVAERILVHVYSKPLQALRAACTPALVCQAHRCR